MSTILPCQAVSGRRYINEKTQISIIIPPTTFYSSTPQKYHCIKEMSSVRSLAVMLPSQCQYSEATPVMWKNEEIQLVYKEYKVLMKKLRVRKSVSRLDGKRSYSARRTLFSSVINVTKSSDVVAVNKSDEDIKPRNVTHPREWNTECHLFRE